MNDVVDRVVKALNDGDVDTAVACYAEDATLEDGYDTVGARGRDDLRTRFTSMLERYPALRIEPGWRTTVGDFVVQEETVSGRGDHERHIAVYLVRDGLIARERLVA